MIYYFDLIILIVFFCFYAKCQETVVLDSSDLSIVAKSPSFVDKTLLIKALADEGGRCSILTAPPKFGKSLAVDALEWFYQVEVDQGSNPIVDLDGGDPTTSSANYRLFSDYGLAIMKEEEFVSRELGRTPVVRVDMRPAFPHNAPIKCLYDAMDAVKHAVHTAFKRHHYLLASAKLSEEEGRWVRLWCDERGYKTKIDPLHVSRALPALARCLRTHFGRKVLVLVDDHDHVVRAAAQLVRSESELRDVADYVIGVLNALVRETGDSVRSLVFTGVSTNPHTDGSYFDVCARYGFPGDHAFSQYFGLTEREVEVLFAKGEFGLDPKEVAVARAHFGGYRGESPRSSPVHNTFSVLSFLKAGRVQRFFTAAEFSKYPASFLGVRSVQSDVDRLMRDGSLEVDIPVNVTVGDLLAIKAALHEPAKAVGLGWSPLYVLVEWGFLAYAPDGRRSDEGAKTKRATIKVPNYEVKEFFINKILELKLVDI